MRIIAAGRSDVGLQREHNEDSFVVLERHGLYVVADGMGGHRAGEVASKLATEALAAFIDTTDREDATWPFQYDPGLSPDENRLLTGIRVANKSVYEASVRNPEHRGMGTTVVGALMAEAARRISIAHVGDSRCYRIRGQTIAQLTRDHSLVNEYLLSMPELTDAQRDELPRNVITRALGITEGVSADLLTDDTMEGDVYILCSDGLSGMITDEEILACVRDLDHPEDACTDLIRRANDRGGEDNVTAVVIRVVDESAPPLRRRQPTHTVIAHRARGPALAPTPPAGTPMVLDAPAVATTRTLRVTSVSVQTPAQTLRPTDPAPPQIPSLPPPEGTDVNLTTRNPDDASKPGSVGSQ